MEITKGTKADALLQISEAIIDSIICRVPIQQKIVEELSSLLRVRRCIVFKFFSKPEGMYCQIIAGIPMEEHGIGMVDLLDNHPDIKGVFQNGKIVICDDPRSDPLTDYFKQTIETKNIVQILYIPLRQGDKKIKGLIVIDITNNDDREKKFSDEEIKFCSVVGKLIAKILEREEILNMTIQDEFSNRIVSLRGFVLRMKKQTKGLEEELDIILDDTKLFEELISKRYGAACF